MYIGVWQWAFQIEYKAYNFEVELESLSEKRTEKCYQTIPNEKCCFDFRFISV